MSKKHKNLKIIYKNYLHLVFLNFDAFFSHLQLFKINTNY